MKLSASMLFALPFMLFAVSPSLGDEVKVGDIVVTQPWSRATPGGAKTAAGYLTLRNEGAAADRLIGGSADVAGKIEVHEMSMSNGVMKMRPLDNGLTIAPGKTVKLAPGGYHLMLEELKNPLKKGDKLPITLNFEKAGNVQITLEVLGVGARGPGGTAGSDQKMDMKNMPDHSKMKM